MALQDPVTPLTGERDTFQKARDVRQRLFSLTHEVFDITSPSTPPPAIATDVVVTMAAMRALFDENLQPVAAAVGEIKQEVASLQRQVVASEMKIEKLSENLDATVARVTMLEEGADQEKRYTNHQTDSASTADVIRQSVAAVERQVKLKK